MPHAEEAGPGPTRGGLDRHERRRRQGIPTVTLLAGSARLGADAWWAYAQRWGLRPVEGSGEDVRSLATSWLGAADACGDLGAAALSACGVAPLEARRFLETASGSQARAFCERHAPSGGAVRRIALALAERRPLAAAAAGAHPGPRDVAEVADLAAPAGALPAFFVRAGPGAEALEHTATALVEIALESPRLPLALAAPAQDIYSACERVGGGRLGAILREGLLYLEGTGDGSREAPPPPSGPRTDRRGELARALDQGDDDRARSAAERLLFELLESHPETAGLFELNGRLPFRFGPAAAEIDLLCRSLVVALEIDGPHHFRDRSAYRRDRRKDLLLQEHGFTVVRVLAEDVADDPASVLEFVVGAVVRRRDAKRPT